MKCTWNNCGKETGKECPPEWIKHSKFDPRVLWIFFKGTKDESYLSSIDAFVCSKCFKEWEEYKRRSTMSTKAAQKRKNKQDFSI